MKGPNKACLSPHSSVISFLDKPACVPQPSLPPDLSEYIFCIIKKSSSWANWSASVAVQTHRFTMAFARSALGYIDVETPVYTLLAKLGSVEVSFGPPFRERHPTFSDSPVHPLKHALPWSRNRSGRIQHAYGRKRACPARRWCLPTAS